tara:strand:+ start:2153 stop:3187 length:1035 start_codon:yes stop_codon:yes gene_type:complete
VIQGKNILVTGGTGSFGKAFIKELIKKPSRERPSRIVVFSRDELKQWDMRQEYPHKKYPELRFFLGDVRDKDRLTLAFQDIDYVVHSAALKQVPAAEYNPMECIKTNVIGSENVIQAAMQTNVKKVVALSTDKASSPINIYGASKLCADKLFIAANNIVGKRDLSFSVVRYGNVIGSRGSVIPLFIEKAKKGILPITSENMTRFNISLKDGVGLVLWAFENSIGGEIFVPKIPSYNILDVAKAVGPNCKIEEIGIRVGEKLHEDLITSSDSLFTYDLDKYYVILPNSEGKIQMKYINFYKEKGITIKKVDDNFSYSSGMNVDFLSVDELRQLIKENIDPEFKPI